MALNNKYYQLLQRGYMEKKNQDSLFESADMETVAEKEWVDMPEYVSEKKKPYTKINVRFRNNEDLKKFAKLIEQNLTDRTQTVWFPKLKFQEVANKVWDDEK